MTIATYRPVLRPTSTRSSYGSRFSQNKGLLFILSHKIDSCIRDINSYFPLLIHLTVLCLLYTLLHHELYICSKVHVRTGIDLSVLQKVRDQRKDFGMREH